MAETVSLTVRKAALTVGGQREQREADAMRPGAPLVAETASLTVRKAALTVEGQREQREADAMRP